MDTPSIGDNSVASIYCKHAAAEALKEVEKLRRKIGFLLTLRNEMPLIWVSFRDEILETFDIQRSGFVLNVTKRGFTKIPVSLTRKASMEFRTPQIIHFPEIPLLDVKWSGFWSVFDSEEVILETDGPKGVSVTIPFEPGMISLEGKLVGDIAPIRSALDVYGTKMTMNVLNNIQSMKDIDVKLERIEVERFIADGMTVAEEPPPPRGKPPKHPQLEELKTLKAAFPVLAPKLKMASKVLKKALVKRDSLLRFEDHFRMLRVKFENGETFDLDITKGKQVIDILIGKEKENGTFLEIKPEGKVMVPMFALAKLSLAFGGIPLIDADGYDGRCNCAVRHTGIRLSYLRSGFHCHLDFSFDSTIHEFGSFHLDERKDISIARRLYATVNGCDRPFSVFSKDNKESYMAESLPRHVQVRLDAVRVRMLPLLPRLEFLGAPVENLARVSLPDNMKIYYCDYDSTEAPPLEEKRSAKKRRNDFDPSVPWQAYLNSLPDRERQDLLRDEYYDSEGDFDDDFFYGLHHFDVLDF